MPLDRLATIKQAVVKVRELRDLAVLPTLEEDMDAMCISVFGGREVEVCGLQTASCEM